MKDNLWELIKYHKSALAEVNWKLHRLEAYPIAQMLLALALLALKVQKPSIIYLFLLLPAALVQLVILGFSLYKYIVIPKNVPAFFYTANPFVRKISTSFLVRNSEDLDNYEKGFELFEITLSESDLKRHAYNLFVLNYYKTRFYLTIRKLEIIQLILATIGGLLLAL